jgi:hypothetical protein
MVAAPCSPHGENAETETLAALITALVRVRGGVPWRHTEVGLDETVSNRQENKCRILILDVIPMSHVT